MEPLNLATVEINAFDPARDFERSKAFYQAIGFTVAWTSDDLAYLHCGESSFLLQKFFVPQHADNFMMHLLVENVDDWHRQMRLLLRPIGAVIAFVAGLIRSGRPGAPVFEHCPGSAP